MRARRYVRKGVCFLSAHARSALVPTTMLSVDAASQPLTAPREAKGSEHQIASAISAARKGERGNVATATTSDDVRRFRVTPRRHDLAAEIYHRPTASHHGR